MSAAADHQAETDRRNQVAAAADITDRVMRWLTPFLAALTAAILLRAEAHGGPATAAIQAALIGMVIFLAFGGRRIPPDVRMLIYCGSIMLAGLIGMFRWGLYGSGQVGLLLALFLASMLGMRRWLILLVVAGVGVMLVAAGWTSGRLPLDFDPYALIRSGRAWAAVGGALLVAALTPLTWEQLYRRLRESEARYRAVFNAGGDALFIHDPDGRLLEVNARACEMLGMDPDQAVRASFEDLAAGEPPFSPVEAMEKIRLACTQGPQVFEWRARRRDGALFWVEVNLRACTIDGKQRVVAAVRDISDRKAAEEALKREKQFSEKLLDSLPGIFYLYDADLRLQRWNRNHETTMGYTAGELRGRYLGDWHRSEESRLAAVDRVTAVLAGRIPGQDALEAALLHKDGREVPYLLTAVRLDTPQGPMMMGVGFDISARVRAEQELTCPP